jgi:hypothetical protein
MMSKFRRGASFAIITLFAFAISAGITEARNIGGGGGHGGGRGCRHCGQEFPERAQWR